MPSDNGLFFRRPKTTKEIGDKGISVQVSRAVKDGKLLKAGGVYYYRSGWFENLGDKWETKDIFLHNALHSFRQYGVVTRVGDLETNPVALHKVAAFIRKMAEILHNQADEIDRRAELLALEESPAEAAD